MAKQTKQSTAQGSKHKFILELIASTVGGIFITAILGLVIAPFGVWLINLPIIGHGFEQLCKVSNASCNPSTLTNNPDSRETTTFMCGSSDGVPITFAVVPNRGNVQVIRWISEYFSSSGYDPKTRCEEVSERFQRLYEKGVLEYITTDRMNGYNVVCAAIEKNGACVADGLLFTLKPEENPNDVVRHIFALRDNETQEPLEETERIYIEVQNHLKNDPIQHQRNW